MPPELSLPFGLTSVKIGGVRCLTFPECGLGAHLTLPHYPGETGLPMHLRAGMSSLHSDLRVLIEHHDLDF